MISRFCHHISGVKGSPPARKVESSCQMYRNCSTETNCSSERQETQCSSITGENYPMTNDPTQCIFLTLQGSNLTQAGCYWISWESRRHRCPSEQQRPLERLIAHRVLGDAATLESRQSHKQYRCWISCRTIWMPLQGRFHFEGHFRRYKKIIKIKRFSKTYRWDDWMPSLNQISWAEKRNLCA